MKKYYAVRHGRQSGIVVTTWAECQALTTGFAGAAFKGFPAHQRDEAYKYAKAGSCRKHAEGGTRHRKPKKPDWDEELYPCIERLDFRDTITGVLYRNRCRRRRGPTVRGANYKPHIGNSLPWYADGEREALESERVELLLVSEAKSRI